MIYKKMLDTNRVAFNTKLTAALPTSHVVSDDVLAA